MTGASTAVRLDRPATAPIVWPWVFWSAALATSVCSDAPAAKPSTLQAMTAYIIQPCVAAPQAT